MNAFTGPSLAARLCLCAIPCLFPPHALSAAVLAPSASACGPSVSEQARRTAVEVGLDASALAASGFDVATVGTLLLRLDAVPQSLADFETAKSDVNAAATQLAQFRQAAQDGNQAAAQQLPALEASLANATAAMAAVRSALRDVALGDESPAKVASLANVDAARKRRVPVEFTVVERTTEAWDALESAVRRESRCQRTGETLEAAMASLLASVRAEEAVAAAKTALAANGTAIEAQLNGP